MALEAPFNLKTPGSELFLSDSSLHLYNSCDAYHVLKAEAGPCDPLKVCLVSGSLMC